MRILFAITNGDTGGAQEHVRILVEGMAAAGHDVGVLLRQPSDLADRLAGADVALLPWASVVRDIRPTADLRARRELRCAATEFAPDVLHLHSSKAGALGRRVLSPLGAGRTVFTCHHLPYGPGRMLRHRIVGRVVDQLSLDTFDGIITVGERDLGTLRSLAPHVPIRLIRNAVPLAPLLERGASTPHTALWVARMQHPKDPLLVVRAWEHVVQAVPDARLILCGEGPLSHDLERAIRHSAVAASIEQLGKVPDLAAQQLRSSVFVLASTAEGGISMATQEAMSQGLVPVVTDAGDAQLLAAHNAGEVVRTGDAGAFADAVVGLFTDHDRLRAMSVQALSFSRTRWTTQDMVDATLDFYRRLATTPQPVGVATGD